MDRARDLIAPAMFCCGCPNQLLRVVGSGASATVCEAFNSDRVSRGFAIKVFKDPNDCDTEYEILKDLQHDNIVQCVGEPRVVRATDTAGDVEKKRFFSLEMMVNGSLENLYGLRKLEDFEVNYFVLQLLRAVGYLHRLNIVHSGNMAPESIVIAVSGIANRDIKCSNCLIGLNGRLKLADFGKALKMVDERVRNGGISPDEWAAPELFEVPYYGKPADIWRVACTWIETLNRGRPFIDHGDRNAFGKIPPIPKTVTKEAAELIGRCLNREPLGRPTADELLDDSFFQSVEAEYRKNVTDESKGGKLRNEESTGVQQSVEKINEESKSVENISEEESWGVLIFSPSQPPSFLEDNVATNSPSCSMNRTSDGRDNECGRTVAKLWTFGEVFGVPRRRHNECTTSCSFFDMHGR